MSSDLVSVAIVDKNGRATTVRKRLDKPQQGSRKPKMPSPILAPAEEAKPKTRTPLKQPKALSKAEIASFDEWYASMLSAPVYNDQQRRTYPQKLSPETKALVQRVVSKGVHPEAVTSLLDRRQNALNMSFAPELKIRDDSLATLEISLRVAERMQEMAPEVTSWATYHLAGNVKRFLAGYFFHRKVSERRRVDSVDTEEEIDSIAAVSVFMLNASFQATPEHYTGCNYTNAEGMDVRGTRIPSPVMDNYLRDNPDKAQRVIKYANERKMGSTNTDAKLMIQHLRESDEFGALGDGWL